MQLATIANRCNCAASLW